MITLGWVAVFVWNISFVWLRLIALLLLLSTGKVATLHVVSALLFRHSRAAKLVGGPVGVVMTLVVTKMLGWLVGWCAWAEPQSRRLHAGSMGKYC